MSNQGNEDIIEILNQIASLNAYNKIDSYKPYEFQKNFHHAKDKKGVLANQVALICANQIGKTTAAANEVSFHSTGSYPFWWEGLRFQTAPTIIVAGKRNETTRDVCQNELFGDPFEESSLGTGSIPHKHIGNITRKSGVPNAFSSVMVKHISGKWSKIRLMAFEQGADAFMGVRSEFIWCDEEPPEPIWTQLTRSTFSRKKYKMTATFTPEEGVTKVVDGFLNHIKEGQACIRAGWVDAAHMTKEKIAHYLDKLPPHERDMRSKGIPLMGSGLIFPVSDDDISIDSFSIPSHWRRVCGIDFGIDHPFACVWIAFDGDTNTAYVYDCFKISGALPPMHASAIKKRDSWIPIAWPHDGINRDKSSGVPLADVYRAEGLNLMVKKFSNPPSGDKKEGEGGNGVEVGLYSIHTAMVEGRFKVFSHLRDWFEEKGMYHRKDGKIIDVREDIMSATRYAYQSERHARTKPVIKIRKRTKTIHSNW